MQRYMEILRRQDWVSLLLFALILLTAFHPEAALASSSGGGSLPWDTPLTTLKNDITGPVAVTAQMRATEMSVDADRRASQDAAMLHFSTPTPVQTSGYTRY
jgi:hypothetical protein